MIWTNCIKRSPGSPAQPWTQDLVDKARRQLSELIVIPLNRMLPISQPVLANNFPKICQDCKFTHKNMKTGWLCINRLAPQDGCFCWPCWSWRKDHNGERRPEWRMRRSQRVRDGTHICDRCHERGGYGERELCLKYMEVIDTIACLRCMRQIRMNKLSEKLNIGTRTCVACDYQWQPRTLSTLYGAQPDAYDGKIQCAKCHKRFYDTRFSVMRWDPVARKGSVRKYNSLEDVECEVSRFA